MILEPNGAVVMQTRGPKFVPLERIKPPSYDEFWRLYGAPGKPVVITGVVSDWKATSEWNLDWFKTHYGEQRVLVSNPPRLTPSCGKDWSTLGEYIDLVKSGTAGRRYLAQWRAFEDIPELLDWLKVPPYSRPGRTVRPHLWLGPANTIIGFHKDNAHPLDGIANLFVQLHGRKRICLVSPDQDALMYRRPDGGEDYWHSEIDFDNEDYTNTPLFEKAVVEETIIHPGETLFVPAHYWHSVRSLDPSISVSFWWHPVRLVEIYHQLVLAVRKDLDPMTASRDYAELVDEGDVEELGGIEVLSSSFDVEMLRPFGRAVYGTLKPSVREALARWRSENAIAPLVFQR